MAVAEAGQVGLPSFSRTEPWTYDRMGSRWEGEPTEDEMFLASVVFVLVF